MSSDLVRIVALATSFLCCGQAQSSVDHTTPEQQRVVINWAQQSSIGVKTVDLHAPMDDLTPLGYIIGNKKIVAMGEATHGTHEFFGAKSRLFRLLVEQHGFTIFGLETSFVEGLRLDHYVKTGEGDPAALLKGLKLWPWRTKELLQLLQWMRAYNAGSTSRPKLSVYGFDSGNGMILGFPVFRTILAKVDSSAIPLLDSLEKQVNDPVQWRDQAKAGAQFKALHDRLQAARQRKARILSDEEWVNAEHILTVIEQNYGFYFVDVVYEARDRHMAENVTWALRQNGPEAKIFLWAHNSHVDKDATHFGRRVDAPEWRRAAPMGSHLATMYGDSLYVIGADFGSGSFRDPQRDEKGAILSIGPVTAEAASTGSLEEALIKTGQPMFFLNFDGAPPSVAAWLNTPRPSRNMTIEVPIVPSVSYDGLFFTATSSPSQSIDE